MQPEIHVGDIGTLYQVELLDRGQPFDASLADVLILRFGMPNGIVIQKEAVLAVDGSPASRWFLEYEVTQGDGIGSPGEFHDNPGPLTIQAIVMRTSSPDPYSFSSTIATSDTDGQELRIYPNLA